MFKPPCAPRAAFQHSAVTAELNNYIQSVVKVFLLESLDGSCMNSVVIDVVFHNWTGIQLWRLFKHFTIYN